MKRSRLIEGIATSWLLLGGAALSTGACTGDNRGGPTETVGTGAGASSGTSGAGGGTVESCEGDARRECKIDINEDNCFVGEQVCENARWSDCLPIEGDLSGQSGQWQANSISPPAACTGNPCNPVCQTFDEDPMPDLEASGTPPPANAAGTVSDVPASVRNACINDVTTCGGNCTSSGYCQLDTRCVDPPGTNCVPWEDGQFATGSGDPDFTVKVSCDGTTVTVCNRGDVAGGSTTGISQWTPNEALCGGGAGCAQALSTGMSGVATLRGTCPIGTDIPPGDCRAIPCDLTGNPASYIHVNGCDEFACEPESDVNNNWGYFNNSIGCTCSATTTGSSLQPVTVYLMLDSSGSMVSQGLWNPARTAVNSFVTDPGSDTINYAFRMYGNPSGSGCTQGDCGTAACATPSYGPALLDNATYEGQLTSFVNGATTGGNGTPHSAAIAGMAQWGSTYRASNPSDIIALVYITDGASGDCAYNNTYNTAPGGAVQISAPAQTAYANDNVLFYTVALPSANLMLLDELAAQGGTGSAIDLTGSTNVAADLTAALQGIQGNLFSCAVPIPNAATIDPNLVQAIFDPTSGADRPLTEVADAVSCTGGDQFYFSPDAVNPTDIVLCPMVCDDVRLDVGSQVEITGGCAGGYTTQEHIFTYDGDCAGYPAGSSAFWDFLSYDTTIPGDATVEFAISTSNVSEVDAGTGPWTTVATANLSNPDALPGAPIDLRAALSVADAQAPYAALRIRINPTSNGSNSPSVDDWDLQYSCEFNE